MSKFNDWLKRGVGEERTDNDIEGRLFGVTEQARSEPPRAKKQEAAVGYSAPYGNVVVYEPQSTRDIQNLIDFLKRREPAIVNLNRVDAPSAQRMLDFISGAVYALSGSVHNIAAKIYLLTPDGIKITVPDKT